MGKDALNANLRELAATRDALTRYVEILNSPLGAFGATVHEVLWADRRRRDGEGDVARRLDELALPSCEILTRSDIERRKATLDRFERAAHPILSAFGTPSEHPWYGVTRTDLPSVDVQKAVREVGDAAVLVEDLARAVAELEALGVETGPSLQDIQVAVQAIARLSVQSDIPTRWHRGLGMSATRRAAEDWLHACEVYQSSQVELRNHDIGSDGTAGTEAAERLEACWNTLAGIAPKGLCVTGLAAWAAAMRLEAGRHQELAHTAEKTASLLGAPSLGNFGAISLALRAVDLALAAGDEVVSFITSELVDRSNRDSIVSAQTEIAELRSRANALLAEFSIPASTKPHELRQHASALRGAGVFGFLSSSVKAARRCHAELRRTPAKPSRQKMATALLSIAELLEGTAALDEKHEYRAAFGSRYRGLDTNTDAGRAVADWAARVRSELAGADDVSLAAKQTLLAGGHDRIQALVIFGSSPGFVALREHVGRRPEPSASFEVAAAKLEAKACEIDALEETCRKHGIPGSASVAALPDLCRLLRTAHASMAATGLPPLLSSAFGEPPPLPLQDHELVRAALALAAAVDDLPLKDRARLALQNMPPADIQRLILPGSEAVATALNRALGAWADIQRRLGLDEQDFLGSILMQASPEVIAKRLRLAVSHSDELGSWMTYLIEREEVRSLDLQGLLTLWDERVMTGPLSMAFDRVLHHALARLAFASHPELDRFTSLGQEEARARFKALDAQVTDLSRKMLASQLATRHVPTGNGVGKRSDYTDRALILLETGKQKRHIPIRQLLDRAGAAVQALKPCFMMSPLSVAQYLKPTGLRFDLLVIDEASQMRPEDALGAIARSDQFVVVGDPKQLPPTAFFARLDAEADNDETDDEQVDAESILDLAQAVFRPMRRLRWHYRSRHGSLVAFSNREFYDGDLIVFPSPADPDATQGVMTTKVEGIYKSAEQHGRNEGGVRGGGRAYAPPARTQPGHRDHESGAA